MSSFPRTGLFSRNFANNLLNRNRALTQQQSHAEPENLDENNFLFQTINPKDLNSTTIRSNSASINEDFDQQSLNYSQEQHCNLQQWSSADKNRNFISEDTCKLTQDHEGFDDVEEYFNQAVTPQRTPKSQNNQNLKSAVATPKTPLPPSLVGNNVLIAKPIKMISSKIAAHYKKEPRLGVSMSDVEAEEREKRRIEEEILEVETEKLIIAQKELEMMQVDTIEDNENQTGNNSNQNEFISIANLNGIVCDENELDGQQKDSPYENEKEEPQYQSITINSEDQEHVAPSSKNFDRYTQNPDFNDTDIHISQLIKTQVISESQVDFNDNFIIENENGNEPVPDDVLMDRLVEEMLVNDQIIEEEKGEEAKVTKVQEIQPKAAQDPANIKRNKSQPQPRVRRTNNKSSEIKNRSKTLSRRPPTYFPGTTTDDLGFRKSCRQRFTPLRYWANEKVCYGRADDPSITLPVIVQVIKKPELDDPTFATGMASKRRRRNLTDPNVAKMKAQAFGPDCDVEAPVLDYNTGEEEERLIALSHHHVQADLVKDSTFRIHTIFTEGAYMSAGQLHFPPEAQKPTKNSARHALVFYVISGSFRVEINRTSFVIGPGGQFHVPRSNHYTITHISTDKTIEGRLFFCHCKDNSESN